MLHLLGGRDVNLLTHDLQEKVADAIGAAGSHPHHRVESLMGEYFLRARAVSRALWSAQRAMRPRPAGAVRRVGRQFEITPTAYSLPILTAPPAAVALGRGVQDCARAAVRDVGVRP